MASAVMEDLERILTDSVAGEGANFMVLWGGDFTRATELKKKKWKKVICMRKIFVANARFTFRRFLKEI